MMIFMVATSAMAQTKSARPRPKVVTNEPASYKFAYQHGYRGGYEDGFTKGKSDYNENQSLNFQDSDAYQRADRTYAENMGTRAEYQEGYRIGFEIGYNDGYYGRPYDFDACQSRQNCDSAGQHRRREYGAGSAASATGCGTGSAGSGAPARASA
ncbi:MAG: hypothetical protein IPG76_05845 [Acidobacteria bacterium]|nr:hypothetical protein [Acidobacteriota bacterium]